MANGDDEYQYVRLPDGTVGRYPKSVPDSEIADAIDRQFPPAKAGAAATAEKTPSFWEALNKPLGQDVQTQVRQKVSDLASRLPERYREPAAYAGHLLTAIPASIAEAGRRMTTSPLGVATAGAGAEMQALRALPQVPRAVKAAATLAELGTGAAFGAGGAKEALTPRKEGETGLQEFERRVSGAGQALMGAAPVLHAIGGRAAVPERTTFPEEPRVIPPEGRIGPGMRTRQARLPEAPPAGAPPAEPLPPAAPPTAESQLDVVARRLFGRPYDVLTSEEKVVVARNFGGRPPGAEERRVIRGVAPGVTEQRAENMPLPTRSPEPTALGIARPGQPNAEPAPSGTLPRTGPPAAPPPATLGGQPVPRANLDDILRQATGQEPPPARNVPLNEQLRRVAPVTEAPPDPLKAEFPDPAIRKFARANGVELLRAAGDNMAAVQAVHDLTNVEVRQVAINLGIDVGQKHVGSRMLLGEGQISRQDLIDQIIRQGVKPEEIPALAKPQTPLGKLGELLKGEAGTLDIGRLLEHFKPDDVHVSTRIPTAVGSVDAHRTPMFLDMNSIQHGDLPQRLLDAVKDYPDIKGLITREDLRNPTKALNKVINHFADNLVWLHNKIPPELRELTAKWYESVNRMTHEDSAEHGYTPEQSAGVIATQSPQKDWFMNRSLSRRIQDIYKNKQDTPWTPAMDAKVRELATTETVNKVKDAIKNLKDQKVRGLSAEVIQQARTFAERNQRKAAFDLLNKATRSNLPIPEKTMEPAGRAIQGKTLSQLDDPYLQGAWTRIYDETYNSPSYHEIAPDGTILGNYKNADGSEGKVAWQSLDAVEKAIRILRDGSRENISRQLGGEHKVRSFYNNIVDPFSRILDVTADTHAVAAAHLSPFSAKSLQVKRNFSGPPRSDPTGVRGTYPLYAEAYRRAANIIGNLRPNQAQSINWEGIRDLFPDTFKTEENKTKIENIWKSHRRGNISLNQARNQVLDAAGGIKIPDWFKRWKALKAGEK